MCTPAAAPAHGVHPSPKLQGSHYVATTHIRCATHGRSSETRTPRPLVPAPRPSGLPWQRAAYQRRRCVAHGWPHPPDRARKWRRSPCKQRVSGERDREMTAQPSLSFRRPCARHKGAAFPCCAAHILQKAAPAPPAWRAPPGRTHGCSLQVTSSRLQVLGVQSLNRRDCRNAAGKVSAQPTSAGRGELAAAASHRAAGAAMRHTPPLPSGGSPSYVFISRMHTF